MSFADIANILKHDPLVASNFYLEIDGANVATLTEVSGLDLEVEVVEMKQTTAAGQYVFRCDLHPDMSGTLTAE